MNSLKVTIYYFMTLMQKNGRYFCKSNTPTKLVFNVKSQRFDKKPIGRLFVENSTSRPLNDFDIRQRLRFLSPMGNRLHKASIVLSISQAAHKVSVLSIQKDAFL
jgi:hypothetical protein